VHEEVGLVTKQAPFRVALCYPNRYSVAASSLGLQVIYRSLNGIPGCSAARAVSPEPELEGKLPPGGVLTLEDEQPISSYPLIAFSLSYEIDLLNILRMLRDARIPCLREERSPEDPFILIGGPVSLSNVLPFTPFADAIVMGEAEEVLPQIIEEIRANETNEARRRALAGLPGVYVPEHHGLHQPEPNLVSEPHIPAFGSFWTPFAELSNMFLVESSRGCPRYCKFCVVRASNTPMRYSGIDVLTSRIPEGAPRVGFVGAGVSEYPHIKEALEFCIKRGQEIGLSSLRADCLDDEFVSLLAQGGARTMTVASDAPSEMQRKRLAKGLSEKHLLNAAMLARKHAMHRLKIYAIIGLPGEEQEDLDELARFTNELSTIHRITLAVNPLIPKMRTPLATATFCSIPSLDKKFKFLRKKLGRRVDLRIFSPRWAWVEAQLSTGGPETGLAVLNILDSDGGYAAWKKHLEAVSVPHEALEIAKGTPESKLIPRR